MELDLFQFNVKIFLVLISFLVGTKQVTAETNERSIQMMGAEFSEVLKYADAGMWDEAGDQVEKLNNSVAFDILQWLKLRAGISAFSEYESFLLLNDSWPGMNLLRSQGEKAINSSVKPHRILKYFSNQRPLTANGSLRLAKVYLLNQETKKAEQVMRHSWLNHSYSESEFKRATALFGAFLEKLSFNRLDNLLWSGRVEQAEAMLPYLSQNLRNLFKARIALKKRSFGVDSLIKLVPLSLKNDPGLLFDRFSYRKYKSLHTGAEEMLLEASTNANMLGKPEFWVKGRSFYARRALLKGKPITAYKISRNHFVNFFDDNIDKEAIELEWLAGFIAFEYLKDYNSALEHFKRFNRFVINPINKAKASYWIGRSFEKLSKLSEMREAFAIGAKYQTTFYGQLSAERGNLTSDATLISKAARYKWHGANFMQDSMVKSAILLYFSGRSVLADRFFNHTSESLSRLERLELSQLAHDLGLKASGLSIAKTAGKAGMFCPDFLFPTVDESDAVEKDLRSLVVAIIRQESGFFFSSKSSAGALGPMQVMPKTAAFMAKKLDLTFSEERLLRDKQYNIKIGTYFLKRLFKKFNGSKVLSIAAYNAGPQRIREWIEQIGDPRTDGVDPLVWIELIPFVETRNYVKRVMEADWVYAGIFDGRPVSLDRGRKSFGHKF